jgi:SAM-dependent methyltransferase
VALEKPCKKRLGILIGQLKDSGSSVHRLLPGSSVDRPRLQHSIGRIGIMNENPAASDWTAARGEKWRAQLAGMEAMLTPVDEPLIRALNLDAPCRIADIGCGGGGTTLEILRRAPAGSVVHGFDLSPALIELARSCKRSDERAIGFEIADMATATAPEKPYDRLVSRFGIMFFDDPLAAFANLVRWLAPGGRFAFAVWGRPAENPWMTSVRQVVAEIIPLPMLVSTDIRNVPMLTTLEVSPFLSK